MNPQRHHSTNTHHYQVCNSFALDEWASPQNPQKPHHCVAWICILGHPKDLEAPWLSTCPPANCHTRLSGKKMAVAFRPANIYSNTRHASPTRPFETGAAIDWLSATSPLRVKSSYQRANRSRRAEGRVSTSNQNEPNKQSNSHHQSSQPETILTEFCGSGNWHFSHVRLAQAGLRWTWV